MRHIESIQKWTFSLIEWGGLKTILDATVLAFNDISIPFWIPHSVMLDRWVIYCLFFVLRPKFQNGDNIHCKHFVKSVSVLILCEVWGWSLTYWLRIGVFCELGQRGRLKQGNEIEGGHSWRENGINKGTEVRMFMRMNPCRT